MAGNDFSSCPASEDEVDSRTVALSLTRCPILFGSLRQSGADLRVDEIRLQTYRATYACGACTTKTNQINEDYHFGFTTNSFEELVVKGQLLR